MKKLYIYILPLMLVFGSCEKYLDVNKNIDAPDYVEGYLYLSGIQQAYNQFYWDIRATGPLTQMMGTSSYTSFANHFYVMGSDAGGQIWHTVYFLQGMNLENLINQSLEAEDWTLAGIGYAMKAFSWDAMTKQHGDLPMKDAFIPEMLSHSYDYQDEIYPQIREWAYTAIELLERPDNTVYGDKITKNDWIYGGDKDKWIRFAYATIVRNLASLTNKNNFSEAYAQELLTAAERTFQSPDDDATLSIEGGAQSAPYASFNNFWGTTRPNLSNSYWQHDYAVQVMTGTVPEYDQATGDKIRVDENPYYPFRLAEKQIVTDTLHHIPGHYDPRMVLKLATTSNPNYENLNNEESVKTYQYFGSGFTSSVGPIDQAPNFYGARRASRWAGITGDPSHDGIGRWLYRDNAPYILMTYAELQFCVAEAYWKLGRAADALDAFKRGVAADVQTAGRYIHTGSEGNATGGDKITRDLYNKLATEYVSGPYVNGLTLADFSLAHIMMQKWVALYPWGALEAWVDMRKYHYDIDYTGDYPSNGNGWIQALLDHKWDTDPSKVYKGLYMAPAQVQNRKGSYDIRNDGSPSYRIRPRFNSEYMWNLPALETLKPIAGTADNYHTSIPWFAYPGDMPR